MDGREMGGKHWAIAHDCAACLARLVTGIEGDTAKLRCWLEVRGADTR